MNKIIDFAEARRLRREPLPTATPEPPALEDPMQMVAAAYFGHQLVPGQDIRAIYGQDVTGLGGLTICDPIARLAAGLSLPPHLGGAA